MKKIALVLALAVAGAAHADKPHTFDAKSAFEALKGMAGTWTGTVNHIGRAPEPATVTYAVTAGGSAVKETLFPGTPHEMVTMYYREGDGLVLVHYCAAGNQPKMRLARVAPARRTLKWEFAGGSNLNPRKDMHMHEASMKLVSDDKVESAWTSWKGGKREGTVTMSLARAK